MRRCSASLFPPAWVAGTAMLSVAKILENMEIGHNILHGQWDWMRDPKIHSTTWEWDTVISAKGWKHTHNDIHHRWTNVIGKDRDVGYTMFRMSDDQRVGEASSAAAALQRAARAGLRLGDRALRPRARRGAGRQQVTPGAGRRHPRDGQEGREAVRQGLRAVAVAVRTGGAADPARQRHRQRRAQRLVAHDHLLRPLPRRRRDLHRGPDRGREPRRLVSPPAAGLGQHRGLAAVPHHDRQPVPPDRAPSVPRPAEQPVRRDRAEGARAVREVRRPLRDRIAVAAVRLDVEAAVPAVPAVAGEAQGGRQRLRPEPVPLAA